MKLSIKARITLWYALLLLVIAAAAVLSVSALSAYSLDRYYRDTLGSATTVILDEMDIEHGVIEIDSDVDEVPNVYASLCDQQGKLIYGRLRVDAPFEADSMRSVEGRGHRWYIQDTLISVPGHERIWLRVHMLADVSFGLLRLSVYLVPLLALVALAGGYLITAQAFRPVRRMTEMADSIAGGNDLSRRIPAGGAGDELHA
ncbi:MAG: HAMP domain-containing protein, partial [Eubacteriales bacterium]|nr:HAMP domain-containing protein [Eubacteriales bacterium]